MNKNTLAFTALATTAALALSACSGSSQESKDSDGLVTITVGASPAPHAKILAFVQDNLAEKAGLNIEVKEYQDYVQPNVALNANEIDANFFQHIPYLDEDSATNNYKFEHGKGIHIEPYGVYSEKLKSLDDLPEGATIAITNDPSNQARALELLVKNKVITLKDVESPTIYDLASNPKNISFKEAEAPAVAKLLPDVDAAIINGNYALQNNLNPAKDAIYLESGEDNPYANILVWNSTADKDTIAAVKKLDELLHSAEVSDYLKKTFPNGEVIPAF